VDAGLGRWRIEDELRLAVFLGHRVVTSHNDHAIGVPVRSKAEAKDRKVHAEGKQRRSQDEEDDREKDPPEAVSQSDGLRHEALIIARRAARQRRQQSAMSSEETASHRREQARQFHAASHESCGYR